MFKQMKSLYLFLTDHCLVYSDGEVYKYRLLDVSSFSLLLFSFLLLNKYYFIFTHDILQLVMVNQYLIVKLMRNMQVKQTTTALKNCKNACIHTLSQSHFKVEIYMQNIFYYISNI